MARQRPTRFSNLDYCKLDKKTWQFVDANTGQQIGPHYPTKEELLADAERFAEERGIK
jgi:hypothetical protein